jgi:hypothetical protein
MEVKLEKLLLNRTEVAEALGFSLDYLKKIRDNPRAHFPAPVYFSDRTSIRTPPYWKLKDIQEWVDKYQGLENG